MHSVDKKLCALKLQTQAQLSIRALKSRFSSSDCLEQRERDPKKQKRVLKLAEEVPTVKSVEHSALHKTWLYGWELIFEEASEKTGMYRPHPLSVLLQQPGSCSLWGTSSCGHTSWWPHMMINLLSCFNLSWSSPLIRSEDFQGWLARGWWPPMGSSPPDRSSSRA